jgi:hypothetical protein
VFEEVIFVELFMHLGDVLYFVLRIIAQRRVSKSVVVKDPILLPTLDNQLHLLYLLGISCKSNQGLPQRDALCTHIKLFRRVSYQCGPLSKRHLTISEGGKWCATHRQVYFSNGLALCGRGLMESISREKSPYSLL